MAGGAQLYVLIWWVSVVLALAAISVMTVLVAMKFVRERAETLERQVRSRIRQRFGEALESSDSGPPALPALDKHERRVLPRVVGELLEQIPDRQHREIIPLLRDTGVVADLADILENGDRSERIDAAAALAHFPGREAIEAFRKALADEAMEIRVSAIKALADWRAIPYMNWLLDGLGIDDTLPARDVIEAIAEIPRQEEFWIETLRSLDSPPGAKVCAIRALAREDLDEECLRELLRATQAHEPDVRGQALRALGILRKTQVLKFVPDALQDTAWPVRTQAAFCAGRLRFKGALPALSAMLDSDFWWERYRAAEAVARLGPEGRAVLERAAQRPTAAGRIASIALSEAGGPA